MRLILVCCLLISVNGFSQWKDYIISVRGDTLNKVDMNGKKQGPWVIHVDDLRGERGYEEQGYFDNDQKTGTWKRFSLQGVKIAEENYSWGKLNGKQQYFTYFGGLERVEHWRAMDPKIAFDTVAVYDLQDPTKLIDRVIVKNDGVSLKHGAWIFYDPKDGRVEEVQHYVMNKLQTDEGDLVSDDEIRPIEISRNKSDTVKVSKPQVILDYEKKNSGKKKIRVRDGSTGN
jgi:hypothetical protein